ncbi:MAG: hypothetical protein V4496_00530 [Pseudomonadota bacterium]
MPLFTSLASFNINLAQKIDIEVLKKALSGWLESEVGQKETSLKNKQLIECALSESLEDAKSVLRDFTASSDFDEKTWVALHIACHRSPQIALQVSQFINDLLLTSLTKDVNLQARLFLISQPDCDMAINESILALEDDWGFLAYLTRTDRAHLDDVQFSERFTRIVNQQMKYNFNDNQRTNSFLKFFIETCGLEIKEVQALLNNIVKLPIHNFNEYKISALRAILHSFGKKNDATGEVIEINPSSNLFLVTLATAFYSQWTIADRTEEQKTTYERKTQRNPALAEGITKDQNKACARALQTDFMSLIKVNPALLNFDPTLQECCKEKMDEALKVVSSDFIGNIYSILKNVDSSLLDWLMTLDIFVSFDWIKLTEEILRNFLCCVFNNKKVYQAIKNLNLNHPDRPLFAFMTKQASYDGLDEELVKDFFCQEEFTSDIQKYLICSSNAFKALPYIAALEIVKNFIGSLEYEATDYLDKFMSAPAYTYPAMVQEFSGVMRKETEEEALADTVKKLSKIVAKLEKKFHPQAFVERLLGYHSNSIEDILKNLFPEKYTLAPLSELTEEPEKNRIYIGIREGKLRAIFISFDNKIRTEFALDRNALESAINKNASVEELLEDPINHPVIFEKLLMTSAGVRDRTSPQDIDDIHVKRAREAAERKIRYIFKLAKIVYRQAPEEYEKLKKSLAFKKLVLRYAYSKYSNNAYDAAWKTSQETCLKYINEHLTTLLTSTVSAPIGSEVPFLQHVYVQVKEKRKFQYWAKEILFYQLDGRLVNYLNGTTEIGGKKLAQTLIYTFNFTQIEHILRGTGIEVDELYGIAGMEIGDKLNKHLENEPEDAQDPDTQLLNRYATDLEKFRDHGEISFEKIKEISAFVKLNLSPALKMELYQNDIYVVLGLRYRRMNYENKIKSPGLFTQNLEMKNEKARFLGAVEYNYEAIKNNTLKIPLLAFYKLTQPLTKNIALVEAWFRKVILKNNPWVGSVLSASEDSQKGSKTAETLMTLSDDFLKKLLKGTSITLIEIWNAARPHDKCSDEADYEEKRRENMKRRVSDRGDANKSFSGAAGSAKNDHADSGSKSTDEPRKGIDSGKWSSSSDDREEVRPADAKGEGLATPGEIERASSSESNISYGSVYSSQGGGPRGVFSPSKNPDEKIEATRPSLDMS